jgi:CubicO group peptidase (beta-lactamase class C family)
MDSTFYGRARPVPLDSLARGYISQGSGGSFIEFELANQSYAITDFDPAAGGAASTVGDMVILLDAVFRDQTVLEPTTTDELLSFVDTPDSFAGGLVSGYGLGVLELDAAAPGHGASGSLLSFGSDGYYLPEQDITYAMAYNGQSTQVADMNRRLVELLTQP